MDEPASSLRDAIGRLARAGLGAVSLTAERADELADALAERGSARRADVREVIEEVRGRWRGDAARVGERAGESLHGLVGQLGLAGRSELAELELRLAQLEHRLRLVEADREAPDRSR